MNPNNRNATMDDIGDELIIDAAKDAAKKAGEEDKIPKHLAVDPDEVASGEEDLDDDKNKDDEPELDEDGKPKPKEKDPEEEDAYIPSLEDDDKNKKPAEAAPAEPNKAAGTKGNPAVDDDELKAYEQELKDAGFEDDSIKMMVKAVQLGGQMALKRLETARAAEEATKTEAEQERVKTYTARRTKEYVAVGNLQNDGRIPKVPQAVQKKIVEGKQLTEDESNLPGVKRQNEVWNHMAKQNQEAVARGEEPALLNFRSALADLETIERSAGKKQEDKTALDKRKKQSSLLKGGSGTNNQANKGGGKPKYVVGQTLDEVTADIMAELSAA